MKLHRFYVPDGIELKHDFWLHDKRFIHQWLRVLRLRAGDKIVLFDGSIHDRLYRIEELNNKETHLVYVTDMVRQLPKRDIYLLWSLLKKDKNDWVLQKCTELGVSHFVPLLAERSEKTGFNLERAHKIIIEAAEQCGRSDIPNVREPMRVETAINNLKDATTLFVCEQSADQLPTPNSQLPNSVGILVGPEGGWSDLEKELFKQHKLPHIDLHSFTLRAETAAVTAISKIL